MTNRVGSEPLHGNQTGQGAAENPYQDDRGNHDFSITKQSQTELSSITGVPRNRAHTVDGYLVGDTMSGGYGRGPDILNACTIVSNPGEVTVIVGPNGAGKSTAMKALFGMVNLKKGAVRFDGEDITALSPQDRVASGMGFVPQTANIFPTLTVQENLEMGGYLRHDSLSETMDQVYDLFPAVRDKRNQAAGELSGGQRQQVAVGRALMTKPKALLLDEPTAGVSPIVMDELFERVINISRTGIAILMVEQNARQALQIADRGYVLVQGENAFTGRGQDLLADDDVRQSFLGG